jgi:type IV secretory pathway TraG/TraD family ATPase VirD4
VVSTSTKPDVLEATAAARGQVGAPLLYDPSGTVATPPGVTRVGWSPLPAARSWDGAMLTAHAMVRAATPGGRGPADDHWTERAAALLAPLLHAAAVTDTPLRTVLHWIDRHNGTDALAALGAQEGHDAPAADLLAGILTTDPREQSGIWSTASGVVAAYRSAAALASTEPPLLDAPRFCDGAHTLYVCAPAQHQRLLAPLVVGLVGDVRDATYRRAGTGGPPVLLALDEVANIAPLPDLPAIVSEGAGQGLLTLACLQDLSQARARWGQQADAFVSLFGTTVVLPGIADMGTLHALSHLAGDMEVVVRGVSAHKAPLARPQRSASLHTVWRPRLPVDQLARGVPGCALAVDDRNQMGWVGLTPAHRCQPFAGLLTPRQRTRALAASPTGPGDHPAGRAR